jgi:SAM-dependent methyltransferase
VPLAWTSADPSRARGLGELCCPTCKAELRFDSNGSGVCGHGALLLAERFFCCIPDDSGSAKAILAWPEKLLKSLDALATERWAGGETDASLAREFAEHGLVFPNGSLTPLGRNVRYHLLEHRWQAARDPFDGLTRRADLGGELRVLDVGCGAAQTLRLLGDRQVAALSGVDRDLAALALGHRLAGREGVLLTLAGASAYSLPFQDGSFDLVMTRVALNYMHQKNALAEMVRVVRPRGSVFCRVEGPLHDVVELVHPGSIVGFASRCRDFMYGAIHSMSGWQPAPGSRLTGGRAFATRCRVTTILESLGCEVVARTATGPRALGHHKQLALLARRRAPAAS